MQPKINLKPPFILIEFLPRKPNFTNQLIKIYNHTHDFIIDPTNVAIIMIYKIN